MKNHISPFCNPLIVRTYLASAVILITIFVVVSVRSASSVVEPLHSISDPANLVNRNISVASPLLASITVNTTDDVVDGNDGRCSFREALFAANFDSASGAAGGECTAGNGDDTISITATGTINLSSVLPAISSNLTIVGPGSGQLTIQRDTGGDYRVLLINNLTTVSISGVTIKNGKVNTGGGSGGGINTGGTVTLTDVVVTENSTSDGSVGNPGGGSGAGISNGGSGSLTMINCVVSKNTTGNGVAGTSQGAGGRGGGIDSPSPLTLINTLVDGNRTGTGPGGSGDGGGFFAGSNTVLINSTVSNNTTGAAPANGGGIWSGGTLSITNTTIVGNVASVSGNGIWNASTSSIRNTIIASNGSNGSGPDLAGSQYLSAGHNLIGNADGSTGFTNLLNGDQVGTTVNPRNALLGPLASNGGLTQTIALLPGSPAIDAADNCVLNNTCTPTLGLSIATDERGGGFNRSADGDGDGTSVVDIGAFEVQSLLVTNTNDSGAGSLRQAITNASVDTVPKAINFQSGLTGTIALSTELPIFFTSVSINGPGANLLTVSRSSAPATPQFRIITVPDSMNVLVQGLTISNGFAASGGGIMIETGGALTLKNCDLSNNAATDFGGGLFNRGTLTVRDSLISGNSVNNFAGGGLINRGTTAAATLINTTVSGNQAVSGGGVFDDGVGTKLTLLNCTITNNTALLGGFSSGLHTNNSTGFNEQNAKVRNTIVAGNVGTNPEVLGLFSSQGHNLIGRSDGTNGFTNSVNGDKVGTTATALDARLAALANNGGPTKTHALLAGSPSLDAGDSCAFDNSCVPQYGLSVTTDQRGAGFNRLVDGPDAGTTATLDIGSFEAQISLPDLTDQTINEDASLSLPINLGGTASVTSITATSSNTTLVPNSLANISISGSGSTRTLLINPVANLFGTSTITITLNGTDNQTTADTFFLTVNSVNDVPSYLKGADQTINENSGGQTVSNWATNMSSGPANEASQTLSFVVTNNSNPGLFSVAPAVSSTGTLTYNPAVGASGVANVSIAVMDNGGVANSGVDTSPSQTLTITVLDGGALQFSATSFSASESANTTLITVKRTGGAAGEARVNYATSNGTATAGQDYTGTSGTLIFPDGVTTQTFSVAISNDSMDEPDETAVLTLSNPSGTGALGSPVSADLSITDDDSAPSLSINDASVTELNSGTNNVSFTVTLSAPSGFTVTANFATADGSATAPADYQAATGQVVFNPGDVTKTINVVINGDTTPESHESFSVNLSSPTNASITDSQGVATIFSDDAAGGIIRFSSPVYDTTEFAGHILLIVDRTGNTASEVTVDYATSDGASLLPCSVSNGQASAKCDYTAAAGTLRIPAGQAGIALDILITQDYYVEAQESLNITLSNPTGGAVLDGSTSTVSTILNITDPVEPVVDPSTKINDFVKQHYHDFLNREADSNGLAFWSNEIINCQTDQQCIEVKRINVSAAFYLSIEFQETGFLAERMYKVAYGDAFGTSTLGGSHQLPVPIIRLNELLVDAHEIGSGLIVNFPGWEQVLENNKQAFAINFTLRSRFTNEFPQSLTATEFVDKLNTNSGGALSPGERNQLINDLTSGAKTRAQILRAVAEDPDLVNAETNRAFVLMQYFGYLRRNPNDSPDADYTGYEFWLSKLNQFNGNFVNAEMVKAFISSSEYRQRFEP